MPKNSYWTVNMQMKFLEHVKDVTKILNLHCIFPFNTNIWFLSSITNRPNCYAVPLQELHANEKAKFCRVNRLQSVKTANVYTTVLLRKKLKLHKTKKQKGLATVNSSLLLQ